MMDEIYIVRSQKLEERLGEMDCRGKVVFKDLDANEMIVARAQVYNNELDHISWRLSLEIISYKRKYELGKAFLIMNINENLLLELRANIDRIY
jgi:hypothetical protein